jgi:sugar-specific transcriptional regulator TrmB
MTEENNQEVTTSSPLEAVQQEIDKLKAGVQEEINKLKEKLEQSNKWLDDKRTEVRSIQNSVWEFLNSAFDSSYDEATITMSDANELLESIGANLIEQEFEGRVTISYSFTVKAEDEDNAREKVESAVSGMEYNFDAGNDDSYSEESIEVDF